MATHANSTPAPARRQPPPIIVDRRKVAAAIERLLAVLDEIDGDPDLEEGGDDEPSLGSLSSCWVVASQLGWSGGSDNELEGEHDGREDDFASWHA